MPCHAMQCNASFSEEDAANSNCEAYSDLRCPALMQHVVHYVEGECVPM